MPSRESIEIRKTIVKDVLQKDVPFPQKRSEWEAAALKIRLPENIQLETERLANVNALWVKDKDNRLKGYAIIYIHGGGLVEGSSATTRELGARLTMATGIPVLIPDYRLAPENPFPAALEDVNAVYRGLVKKGYLPNKIVLGGDSNGGGLALASLVALRDQGTPLPSSLFLISPVVDLTFSGESMTTRKAHDPFTSEEALKYCAELYANGKDLTHPLISPLFADLSGLPPTLIQVEIMKYC